MAAKEYDVLKFEPVLLANIDKPESHTRAVYEGQWRLQGLAQGAGRDAAAGADRPGEEQQSAWPPGGAGFPTV